MGLQVRKYKDKSMKEEWYKKNRVEHPNCVALWEMETVPALYRIYKRKGFYR